jgi:hypothetical protein
MACSSERARPAANAAAHCSCSRAMPPCITRRLPKRRERGARVWGTLRRRAPRLAA